MVKVKFFNHSYEIHMSTIMQLHSSVDENGVESTSSYTKMKDAQISIHPCRQRHDLELFKPLYYF